MNITASRFVTLAFTISVVVIVGFVWILASDIACTARAPTDSLLRACDSKSLAYDIFPNSVLYFLELTDLSRIIQLILLALADLLLVGLLFRGRTMRKPSWVAALLALILFIIASGIFSIFATFVYFSV